MILSSYWIDFYPVSHQVIEKTHGKAQTWIGIGKETI